MHLELMTDLWENYFKSMNPSWIKKKIELIDEVFTKKFIRESGGKKELISKIKSLPDSLTQPQTSMSWKKGLKGDVYFAKLKENTNNKSSGSSSEAEFIVIKENGKLKIDGTIGDGE